MNIVAPQRATHSWTQQLVGAPDDVFPLLCPVRECDWVNGWDPRLVISASGVAEQDCVFTTAAGDGEAIWMVTVFEPPRRIEFVKVTPGDTVARISIVLESAGRAATAATVSYSHTSLSERGNATVAAFTGEYYSRFMREWEAALNHYLRTGSRLDPAPAE